MFLLFLMGLGAASVKAQVRIGGDTVPNRAAVLDLNANNDATPAGNKGALALPRISLASTTAQLNGGIPIPGMLVYNTNASMTNGSGVGIYFWDGSQWTTIAKSGLGAGLPTSLIMVWDSTVLFHNTTNPQIIGINCPQSKPFDICVGAALCWVIPDGRVFFMYPFSSGFPVQSAAQFRLFRPVF